LIFTVILSSTGFSVIGEFLSMLMVANNNIDRNSLFVVFLWESLTVTLSLAEA
jgi:hypothetical protein